MVKASEQTERLERVDAMVRDMFRSITAQPLPSRLLSVLDQLEDEPVLQRPLRQSRR